MVHLQVTYALNVDCQSFFFNRIGILFSTQLGVAFNVWGYNTIHSTIAQTFLLSYCTELRIIVKKQYENLFLFL